MDVNSKSIFLKKMESNHQKNYGNLMKGSGNITLDKLTPTKI